MPAADVVPVWPELTVATTPVAGDDADEVRWAGRPQLEALDLVEGLWESLAEWGMLPR